MPTPTYNVSFRAYTPSSFNSIRGFQYNVYVWYNRPRINYYYYYYVSLFFEHLRRCVYKQSFRNWITVAKCAMKHPKAFSARKPATTTTTTRPGDAYSIIYYTVHIYIIYIYMIHSSVKQK